MLVSTRGDPMKRVPYSLQFLVLICCAALGASVSAAKKPPQEWDGLSLVKLKGMDAAYARPGFDFTIYDKIIVDPIQVAFAKGWDKEETFSKRKLSAEQLEKIKGKTSKVGEQTLQQVFSDKNRTEV